MAKTLLWLESQRANPAIGDFLRKIREFAVSGAVMVITIANNYLTPIY